MPASSSSEVAAREECLGWQARFPDVAHLTPSDLRALQQSRTVTLCDVRSRAEYATSTLPGASHVDDVRSMLRAQQPPPADLVCFCTVGYRSSLEARRLARELSGSSRVYSMAGILLWSHDDGPLVDPRTGVATKRIHLFGKKWAELAPAGFEVEYFRPSACHGLCDALLRLGAALARSLVLGTPSPRSGVGTDRVSRAGANAEGRPAAAGDKKS